MMFIGDAIFYYFRNDPYIIRSYHALGSNRTPWTQACGLHLFAGILLYQLHVSRIPEKTIHIMGIILVKAAAEEALSILVEFDLTCALRDSTLAN